MKYAQKSFTECYGSEDYRNGWERTFGNKKNETEESATQNSDGTYDVELDLPDDMVKFIETEAQKNNLTFDTQASKMIEEGLGLLTNKEKE